VHDTWPRIIRRPRPSSPTSDQVTGKRVVGELSLPAFPIGGRLSLAQRRPSPSRRWASVWSKPTRPRAALGHEGAEAETSRTGAILCAPSLRPATRRICPCGPAAALANSKRVTHMLEIRRVRLARIVQGPRSSGYTEKCSATSASSPWRASEQRQQGRTKQTRFITDMLKAL
jgi:hypothetical protein